MMPELVAVALLHCHGICVLANWLGCQVHSLVNIRTSTLGPLISSSTGDYKKAKEVKKTEWAMEGGCSSAFEAEVSVLVWATDYAARCNWRCIVFEIDAKFVVDDVLAVSAPCGWNSFERLTAIRSRFSKPDWKLVWSPRETNAVADYLAFTVNNNVVFSVDKLSFGELSVFVLDRIIVEQLIVAV